MMRFLFIKVATVLWGRRSTADTIIMNILIKVKAMRNWAPYDERKLLLTIYPKFNNESLCIPFWLP